MTGPARPVAAVVDYGAGNLVSIEQAIAAVGGTARVVTEAPLPPADLLVVPGVGAAAPAMRRLRRTGLAREIGRWIETGQPFLGICLGLQLLFDGSDEDGATTLGIIPGRAVRLDGAPTLPHIGWNQVERRRATPAFDGVEADADVYFVHSYAGVPEGHDGARWVVGETEHGGRFVSAVALDNVVGLQFHPERSGAVGLRILGNVLDRAIA